MSTPAPTLPAATPQATAVMTPSPGALAWLFPAWYAPVMGLAGLSLAWQRAVDLLGPAAGWVSLALAGLAAVVFGLLAAATLLRGLRHPQAWADDRGHPVRHAFVATLPVAALLVATAGLANGVPAALVRPLWWAGSAGLLVVTAWVLGRWWKPAEAGGLGWAAATPALFIPIVGNVLAPLAGVPLGHVDWAAAQFGIGLLFWPVVTALLVVRLAVAGPWPARLMPATAIFIAPPTVVGLSALQLGAPPLLGWICWGMAAFSAAWVALQARAIAALPFALPHWALSFPLAALSALTLRMAVPGSLLGWVAPVLLAAVTMLVAALAFATLRGLRRGTLLVPEPVAAAAVPTR